MNNIPGQLTQKPSNLASVPADAQRQPHQTSPTSACKARWFWQGHRRGLSLVLAIIIAVIVGSCTKSCSNQQRSPFSGLLPADTPLVIEGSPQDVSHFLEQMDIAIPALGNGQELSGLACSRLLYATIPPDSNGDFYGCKKAIMKTVNSLEENWSANQSYPATLEGLTPRCPYGGQITYRLTDNGFALSCQGSDHQTSYDSILGFSANAASKQPLVFIAFYSDDPLWNEAAISPQHPDLKILSSDPDVTVQYLTDVQAPLEISYPQETSLYVSVVNASLPTFWTKLPAELPGKYTTITKNSQTGIYSLRAQLAEAGAEDKTPTLPTIEKTLACLPQGQTRVAASCALLKSLNLLPLSPAQQEYNPLTLGMATNAQMRLAQLLPTFSSGLAGLTQSSFAVQFSDDTVAQQSLKQSPWGDLSQPTNPQCTGTCQGSIAMVNIGDPLPVVKDSIPLPPGVGPVQLGGVITLTVSPQDVRVYAFSGGVHANQLWLEVQPMQNLSANPVGAYSPTPTADSP